jgi:hypothetical protein
MKEHSQNNQNRGMPLFELLPFEKNRALTFHFFLLSLPGNSARTVRQLIARPTDRHSRLPRRRFVLLFPRFFFTFRDDIGMVREETRSSREPEVWAGNVTSEQAPLPLPLLPQINANALDCVTSDIELGDCACDDYVCRRQLLFWSN